VTARALIDTPLVARVAGAVVVATLAIALVVGVALAPAARGWLHFGFAGVKPDARDALLIFANNCKLAAVPIVAGLMIQLRRQAQLDAQRRLAAFLGAIENGCALALAGAVIINLALVGASLGAYGSRMARAILPHGPFELAAYSTSLGFYLRLRREAVPAAGWAASAILVVGLLAVAAVLETFVAA
jgi:hypothetical protein